jgi:acetyl-CoA carboxylase biotin carboxylase subunit
MSTAIKKILIANRGEIAVRIMRACRDLDIASVAVYSDIDQRAFHVRMADEAVPIGASASSESYLVHDKIIEAAKATGADAIHPGYGFLAENAKFAKRCEDEGIIFIGPSSKTIALLGDKIQARNAAVRAGLPVVPGAEMDGSDIPAARKAAEKVGYPVLIKAAAGGGGKGMRVVENPDDFEEAVGRAASEAKSAFGDGRVFIERYLKRPRHIEFQILADQHGNCIHLGERECSIQRRHQKLIEESPSAVMTPELRQKMGTAAVNITKATGYVGAGTVEFLVDDEDMSFYFLEVNTRLQVEHPVTELVTGLDLVKQQIAVAEGRPLAISQGDVELRGHAIECRISAEDTQANFMPSTGTLNHYRIPAGPGVRVDSGVVIYSEIPIFYDPMFAKLIVWGADREEAIRRMSRALEEFRISGVRTTIGFHRAVMNNKAFAEGRLSTRFIEEEYPDGRFTTLTDQQARQAAIAIAVDKFIKERRISVQPAVQTRAHSNWKEHHRRENLRVFEGKK